VLTNSEKLDLNGLAGTAEELHGRKPHVFAFVVILSVFLKFTFNHLPIFATNDIEGKKECPERVATITTLSGFHPRGNLGSKQSNARTPKKWYVILYFKTLTQCT